MSGSVPRRWQRSDDLWVEFDRHKLAPRYVRYRILDQFPQPMSLDWQSVLIIASELVANAVRHGGAPGSTSIWIDQDRVRLEVFDCSIEGMPTVHVPSERSGWKLGLCMVNRLASDWGVDVTAAGKTVWAEIEMVSRDRQTSASE